MSDETLDDLPKGAAQAVGADGGLQVADCEETVLRLYYYLDGELTEERRHSIEAHLDDCGSCVEVLGFEAELRRVVADRCKDRVPDKLLERIADAIHHEQLSSGGDR
jgi:mycothiol system anti-sigma-R factor